MVGSTADTKPETTLRERLVGSASPERREAAAALAREARRGLSVPSVARLAGRVRRDPDPHVRRWAIEALGHAATADDDPVRQDGAIRPAVDRALDDEDERVRAAAVLAAARIDPEPTERLLGTLEDGSAVVRRNGVVVVGASGADARGHLAKRLDADADHRVRAEAATVLPSLTDDDDAVDLLADALDAEPNPIVRTRIVDALGRLGTERAVTEARRARGDDDPAVRRAAARATDPGPASSRGRSRGGQRRAARAGSRHR